jgi:hypothetical protein
MQSGYHNVPIINGVMQKDGREFEAKDIVSRPGFFSADISGAYPEEASVSRWVRSYKVKGESLEISDSFTLDELKSPNEIVFMAWGKVSHAKDGQVSIKVADVEASLEYPAADFDAVIEPITLNDPKIIEMWGREIVRIRLVAEKLQKKSTYKFRICY